MESLENIDTTEISSNDLFEYFKDSEAKVEIISKLPRDFPEQVIKYVKEVEKECEETGKSFDRRALTNGRVFEILVREQFSRDKETTEEEHEIASEIQGILDDPAKYRLQEKFKFKRIPDLAHVKVTKRNHVYIDHAVEAKFSTLGSRSRSQLIERKGNEERSFKATCREVARKLNTLSKDKLINKHGLKASAKIRSLGNFFMVSPNFETRLVVPSDRDIKSKGFEKGLIRSDGFTEDEIKQFEEELKDMDRKGNIENSIFSNIDVGRITNRIMERM